MLRDVIRKWWRSELAFADDTGAVREWVSDRPFVLTIGNAGGVAFELNGEPLPSLGGSGTVIPRLVVPAESR